MSLFDDALSRVHRAKKDSSGDWWSALCPVHESDGNGHKSSLRIAQATRVDDGVIVTCMGGCSREDLQRALGFSAFGSKTSPNDSTTHLFYSMSERPSEPRLVATYDYTDESGVLLFQKLRYDPKRFMQRSADGGFKLDGVRRVLYHLPEVVKAASAGELIAVTEGEKGADALRSTGITATCASGGAGKWRADYAASLAGARVIVCPDRDEQGRKHGEVVIAALRRGAVMCAVLNLPDLPEKGDPFDAVQAGLTKERFLDLTEAAFARRDEAVTQEAFREKAADFRLTEGGNAERFAAQHHHHVASVRERGLLAYQDGIYVDDGFMLDRYAKETVLSLYEEAARAGSETGRRALAEHAKRSDTNRARSSMLALASSEPELEVPDSAFDSDPTLLCVRNGIVDLRAGTLKPHSPKVYLTKQAGASYTGRVDCTLWLQHLERIFASDTEMISFLQRLMGYSLTGLTSEQVFAVFYGSGANGKSVTLHMLEKLMGAYARTASATTFAQRAQAGGQAREDLLRLQGCRLVTTFESDTRKKLDEELVKQLTGGDRVAVRGLYKGTTEYVPQFLIVMSTNHKPTVEVADYAIKRRVLMVPFNVTIPAEEQDRDLEKKLVAELNGILSWCVAGSVDYLSSGLRQPESVVSATEQAREEMDPMNGFREYIIFDGTAWTASSEIRTVIDKWAKEEGVRSPTASEFGTYLQSLGAIPERRRIRGTMTRGWRGIMVEGCHVEHSMGL